MSLFRALTAAWLAFRDELEGLRDPWYRDLDLPPTDPAAIAAFIALIENRQEGYISYWPSVIDLHRVVNAQITVIDDPAKREQVAELLVEVAQHTKLPLYYLAACSYQESRWDPTCFNHNLFEYGGKESFGGTDWGFAQNSGYNLLSLPSFKGLTQEQMIDKALDPEWAIPYFGEMMTIRVNWAKSVYDQDLKAKMDKLSSDVFIPPAQMPADPDLDPYIAWLATSSYNAGSEGALSVIAKGGLLGNGAVFRHGNAVQTWMRQFKGLL